MITLQQLSYIWISFSVLLLISSFIFLDWTFPILNLPYRFNTELEKKNISSDNEINQMKWYRRILERKGVWHYLTSPLYILVVLFLSFLLLTGIFLSVTWYPWVYYITNRDTLLSKLSIVILCIISQLIFS
jgi:hypothetical protein